jgi:ABC-type branched-subunit amino acid transport system substrate-binding protein
MSERRKSTGSQSYFSFPSVDVSRRTFLRGSALVGGMGLLAACTGNNSSGQGAAIATDKVKASSAKGLNEIFGPGGKEGGAGVTISAGMLLAMTGQGSFFGKVMSSGAKLAAAQIKAADGMSYDIHIADHKSGQVPAALSGTRQMITQDKIRVLQTSYGAPSEAIVPLIAQNKLLSFNGGGSSPGQVGKPYLWQTRMIFGDDPCPGGLAWLVKQNPKMKRLAIIGTQENGVAGAKTIGPEVWKQLTGGQVVANEQHDVGATDFSSIIARLKSSKPDAILTFSFGDDVGYFVKQLREANVTVPVMGIEFTEQAAKVAGASYDTYNFCADFYDVTNPNPWNKIFVDGYKTMFGEAPEYYGANYYEEVFFVWELVRRVIAEGGDPTDTVKLEAALESNPKFKSLYGGDASTSGEVEFNPQDHTISKPMAVFKVVNGKPVKVQDIVKISAGEDPNKALV